MAETEGFGEQHLEVDGLFQGNLTVVLAEGNRTLCVKGYLGLILIQK